MLALRMLGAVALLSLALQPVQAGSPDATGPSSRVMIAMDKMNMQSSGGIGASGSQPGQGMSGMGTGMMCCGMGGMSGMQSGSTQPSTGQSGMQQSSPGQMGGMADMSGMKDNMRQMPPMGGMQGGSTSGSTGGAMGMSDDNMRRMQQNQAMPGMNANGVDMTDRIDGRTAFLRAELRITEAQAPAWNQFADALRSSRQHLLEARQQLAAPANAVAATARLEQYERHLGARLEALRTARASFSQLHTILDEHQKHVADELVIPFLATF